MLLRTHPDDREDIADFALPVIKTMSGDPEATGRRETRSGLSQGARAFSSCSKTEKPLR
jgi:hypothetical protein